MGGHVQMDRCARQCALQPAETQRQGFPDRQAARSAAQQRQPVPGTTRHATEPTIRDRSGPLAGTTGGGRPATGSGTLPNNCTAAQNNLQTYTNLGHKKLVGDDGVAYYPSAEELAAKRAEAQQQIDTYCQ